METVKAIATKKAKTMKVERKCLVIVLEKDLVFLPWASKEHMLKDFQEYSSAFNAAIDIAKTEKCQVVKIYEVDESKWKALNEKAILKREDLFCEHVIFELYAHRPYSL